MGSAIEVTQSMLPFTEQAFFDVFARYNAAIWPVHFIAHGLALGAGLATMRPGAWSDRFVSVVLASLWLWTGIAYHLMFFAAINPPAIAFGLLFVAEGLVLAWSGGIRNRLHFAVRNDAAGLSGMTLAAFAVLGYPLAAALAGHVWPQAAMFGVTPCPTTIFTLGMMLLVRPAPAWHLLVIPLAWSLIGGSAVWLIGITEDIALPLAALVMLAVRFSARSAQLPPSAL